jgi:hypothetical protein
MNPVQTIIVSPRFILLVMGEARNSYKILVGKLAGKRPFRRPRHRWEDNIGMVLRETGLKGMDWMYLAQDRDQCQVLANTVMDLGFHKRQGIS